GLQYEGQAEELIVRTTDGDLGILAGHINCVAPLGMGMATVKIEGAKFEDGIYKVKADDYKIVPVADGQVYSVEIKNGDVIDVYFFSSDKKGVLGYNFNYMIKHISVQVVQ
ncbi:MAG: hypothetical protein IKB55_06135, partial [Clostridia bacterium]|nr:hypothetical protein [Clostridia bacterium]